MPVLIRQRRGAQRPGVFAVRVLAGGRTRWPALCAPQKATQPEAEAPPRAQQRPTIVIVGGGRRGFAAAEMLRRLNYQGALACSAPRRRCARRSAEPVERPSGRAGARGLASRCDPTATTPSAGIHLRSRPMFTGRRSGRRARWCWPGRQGCLTTGCCWRRVPSRCGYRFPVRACPTCTCCSLAGRLQHAIIARAASAKRALVIRASFIGLEVGCRRSAHASSRCTSSAPETQPHGARARPPISARSMRGVHERARRQSSILREGRERVDERQTSC